MSGPPPLNSPAVVADTDVVSFLFKGDTRGARYLPHLTGRVPVISFMTLAELEFWADTYGWGSRRRRRLSTFLTNWSVEYPDERLCRIWAAVSAQARRSGRSVSCADAWVAATALRSGCPLLTHNATDYAGVQGLTLITA